MEAFDDILVNHVGEFGRAQKLYFFLVCLTAIPCAFHSFANTFISGSPKHHCRFEGALKYKDDAIECAIPWDSDKDEWSKCKEYKQYNITGFNSDSDFNCTSESDEETECRSGWLYDRKIYGETVVTEWDLVCDQNWMRQLGKSIVLLGKLIGSLVFGQLSDLFGRKKILLISLLLQITCGVLSSFSGSFPVFITFQFLLGCASSGVFLTAFVIVTEIVGPSWRTFIGITIEYFYTLGYIILTGVAYALRDWQNIELTLSLPGVLFLSYFWILPESPRWLMTKGRYEESVKILRNFAKTNKKSLPEDCLETLKAVKMKEHGAQTENIKALFFTSPTMRWKTILIGFNWLSNSMVYYGLAFHTESLGSNPYLAFFISGAVEVPAYILSQLLLKRLGRKRVICIFMSIGGVVLLSTTVIKDYKVPVLVFAMIGKLCITASYGIVYLYSAELYPTTVRNIGLGFSSICARVGGVSAPYILLIGDYTSIVMPLILFGAQSLLAGILILLLPETQNQNLPDNIKEADEYKLTVSKQCCARDSKPEEYRSVETKDTTM
ncbi:organic cation transporter protein-like [Antedon mediterranea]|uniref:organic cation transporter protein-like n=1 Tax=Antedon mediterranea TaxID=105859 RepID=UPI003AF43A16